MKRSGALKRGSLRRSGSTRRKSRLRRASPRRRMEAELDRAARLECLLKSGGRCERCGEDRWLEAHHVIGRRCRALRWHGPNLVALCGPVGAKGTCHDWWHLRSTAPEREAWFIGKFGLSRWETLQELKAAAGRKQ